MKIRKIYVIIPMIIIIVCLLLFTKNEESYISIELEQTPERVASSPYTNKLVTVTDKELVLYDEEGKATKIKTDFDIKLASPLDESLWVVDYDYNLYEISYSSGNYQVILTDVAYINMAPQHYTAITNSGDLYVWGDNIGHRLGLTLEEYIDVPTKVEEISQAKETAISNRNTIVLLLDGSVYVAGEVYEKDNLEVVETLEKYTLVDELREIEQVYNSELCVTLRDGQLMSWSHLYKDSESEQILMRQNTSVDEFLEDKEAVFCSVGGGFTTYLTKRGKVYYWGYDFLETPDCKCDPYAMPCKEIPYIEDVDMIYAGKNVVYAMKGNEIVVIR